MIYLVLLIVGWLVGYTAVSIIRGVVQSVRNVGALERRTARVAALENEKVTDAYLWDLLKDSDPEWLAVMGIEEPPKVTPGSDSDPMDGINSWGDAVAEMQYPTPHLGSNQTHVGLDGRPTLGMTNEPGKIIYYEKRLLGRYGDFHQGACGDLR